MSFTTFFPSNRFARVPYEVLLDTRLARRHLAVLSTILLHADDAGRARPTLKTLSEITGVTTTEVSRTTSDLVRFGYLKRGQLGYNQPNQYEINCPMYNDGDLRQTSDKRVSDEAYAAKLKENKEARLNQSVSVHYMCGTVGQLSYRELVALWRMALSDGCEYANVSKTEFARHGLHIY
jgi:hypothetical protein